MSEHVLACKRPGLEITHEQAVRTGSVLTACADCRCKVYAMPKNLERGLLVCCLDCAAARTAREIATEGSALIFDGRVIGHPDEAKIDAEAREAREEFRRTAGD